MGRGAGRARHSHDPAAGADSGRGRFTQALAHELAGEEHLLFACGRYEGIDQRVLEYAATRMRVTEVSLGDYVLFGGEVAVLVILEAVIRLLPGVLGNADSLREESHADGLLEGPLYTKPAVWRGYEVPEVLRSGDHARIARWRRDQALLRTADRRPDLLAALPPEAWTDTTGALPVGGSRARTPDRACGTVCRAALPRPFRQISRAPSVVRPEAEDSSDEHAGRAGCPVTADRHPRTSAPVTR